MDTLKGHFAPEFLNRIDETIVFHPLQRSEIRRIVDFQIDHLAKQLAENDLTLYVTEAARNQIAAEGYDPTFGARPLKRSIQQRLQNPLATEILRGEVTAGSGIEIDYRDGEFTFERRDSDEPTTTVETKFVQ